MAVEHFLSKLPQPTSCVATENGETIQYRIIDDGKVKVATALQPMSSEEAQEIRNQARKARGARELAQCLLCKDCPIGCFSEKQTLSN